MIKGRKWEASQKKWHIPYFSDFLYKLNKLSAGELLFEGEASDKILIENNTLLSEYVKAMKKMNYSTPTIKSYTQHFKRFWKYFNGNEPAKISNEQIREFIAYLVNEKKYSGSAQNQAVNAIKLFYKSVLHREIDSYYLPRPRNAKVLPKILNEKEVSKILKSIDDLKEKCIIFLIYSAGLTPSEVSHIKIEDINSKKMQIFISSPRGDKDRFVILSKRLLDLLRDYFKKYKPHIWLFESVSGKQFSQRKMQKIFQRAVKRSKINKPATLTILKNSFAVHLIEKGMDIRYIQQLLGHKHSKTTMKYLKVSKRDLSLIQNPLDDLDI